MGNRSNIGKALALSLSLAATPATAATLTSGFFGKTSDGRAVSRTIMTAASGVSVTFMSYGGAIIDLVAPDREGKSSHVVLGFPTLGEYETVGAQNELYFGALLGRYANWIARGRFTLDGRDHRLSLSDPPNTIHGGKAGFDKRLWTVTPQLTSGDTVSARLTYVSRDGEEGYPGALIVSVIYSLSDNGTFKIHYNATTDEDTVLNLSNHMNFDLAGAGSAQGVLDQQLTIDADRYLPLDASQIPLGRTASVAGTPFDFRSATPIGLHIHDRNPQLALSNGYDQYWILNSPDDPTQLRQAVHAYDPRSGRTLDVLTTEPGVQIYTAGFFDGSIAGTGGRYGKYAGFTVETQHYPDSPNHPQFPSTVLKLGQLFDSTTTFRFGVQR